MDISDALEKHKLWLDNKAGGEQADLSEADLRGADLRGADLSGADLRRADLRGADLRGADLSGADLRGADLRGADLSGADLRRAYLRRAYLRRADLRGADLSGAYLSGADLSGADLSGADLSRAKGLIKLIGVEVGNFYWKRCEEDLSCNSYQFRVGINKLRKHETFASDERVLCSYPGFHFASRSWCAVNYPERTLEVKIRVPDGAQINEPWATDGKASADMIEIVEVWRNGENVTEEFRNKKEYSGME